MAQLHVNLGRIKAEKGKWYSNMAVYGEGQQYQEEISAVAHWVVGKHLCEVAYLHWPYSLGCTSIWDSKAILKTTSLFVAG